MYGETFKSLPVWAFATVAPKSSNCKVTDADIESLKSHRTLFDNYLDHMLMKFEQNRMVKNIQKFEVFGKKWLTIFE